MSPWLFSDGGENGNGEEGSEISGGGERAEMLGLLYANDLVLCDESEEDLRTMVLPFVEMCWRKGLKVNEGKSKVMVLNGEGGLECKVYVDEIRLEHVSEFKYLGCL